MTTKHADSLQPASTVPVVEDAGVHEAPESETERAFFVAGDTLHPLPAEAPTPGVVTLESGLESALPLLAPEILAKRDAYRRRVVRLMLPLTALASWAVGVQLSAIL